MEASTNSYHTTTLYARAPESLIHTPNNAITARTTKQAIKPATKGIKQGKYTDPFKPQQNRRKVSLQSNE